MRRSLCAFASTVLVITQAASGAVIATMDELRFKPTSEKARAELVEGKIGRALRFTFDTGSRSVFCASNVRGTPEWDRAAGFSFWVKGAGGDCWGGLEFIYDEDYALRYDLMFLVRGTNWAKVAVAWRDLIPVLPHPKANLLDPAGENPPSKLSALWFGRWWYWGDYPAMAFAVDDIRLEAQIDSEAIDYRPTGAPLQRVCDTLKAGEPMTIVTMGDSLTDLRHWANREVAWPNLLSDQLRAKFRSQVTIVNPALGGTQLRQNLVLMPRWLEQAPTPNLVTVCFGGNDWESGMRGPLFHQACLDAIDRIRQATRGKADVLLLTTIPSLGLWETRAQLGEACRKAARERNAGLADTEKAFWTAGSEGKARLFAWDKVHLGRAGHELTARTVLQAIESAGR